MSCASMPHFVGYLRRCDGVNEGGAPFLVALDIVGPKPSGEIVRINIDPADGDAARDYGRELALNVLVPLVEGRLEAAPVLSESANAIVVLGAVPGDGDNLRRLRGHSGHGSPHGCERSVGRNRSRRKAAPARPIYDEPPFDRDNAIPF